MKKEVPVTAGPAAAVHIFPEGDGRRIACTIDLPPNELPLAIGGMIDQAVISMKKTLAAA